MSESEDPKKSTPAGAGGSAEEAEEQRLRERLKARVAAERGSGSASPTEADKPKEDEDRNRRRSTSNDSHRRNYHPDRRSGGAPSRRGEHRRHRDDRSYRPYPPPHQHRRGSGNSSSRRHDEDDFGRRRRPSPPPPIRGRRSRSGSPDRARHHHRRSSHHHRSRSPSSHSSYSSYSSDSDSSSSSSSSSSAGSVPSSVGRKGEEQNGPQDRQAKLYSKDQRTVFVQQLVQRATERELYRFFRKQGLKVNEVILLRDKRSNRHKGCAYVEMRKMDDVPKAVALSNTVPTFQRFPILVKASEAEKNYLAQASSSSSATVAAASVPSAADKAGNATSGTTGSSGSSNGEKAPVTKNLMAKPPPLLGPNGKLLESQKVYVGSLDPSVTQEHLFLLYSQFGYLDKVALQTDNNTGVSKGFAFLSFHDPKNAFLAIQTMNGQVLAGRPMKTGWAVNQIPSIPGAEVITAEEFPPDASTRTTSAYRVLAQLSMGVGLGQIREALANGGIPAPAGAATASRVPTVADARASLAAATVPQPTPAVTVTPAPSLKQVGRSDAPTPYILVHNMYDKDEETEAGWEKEIKEEFEEECSQYGQILAVKVMSKEPGGKIYASFASIDGAQKCASSIAGRWFNKRQLRVEFVAKDEIPAE